jgi:UDP-N-acetylglucosamine 2-epimerase
MRDLVARVAPDVRDGDRVLASIEPGCGLSAGTLRPGGYVFATIHRAANRAPESMMAWTSILADAAADRPVVLALHPGTRDALDAAGIALADGIRVVEPQPYRTSIALQLHAAAVVTDSGGIQREAAWLGTPCLVLRSTTEWVELVEQAGRVVVVDLDRARAAEELTRLAPLDRSVELARDRAAGLDLQPSGAAEAIVAARERGP